MDDNEIDIRPYINTLISNWRQLAILTVLIAVLAIVFSLFQTQKFKGTSTILMTRSRATLSLAEQFPTVTEPIDTRSRMDAILSIAQGDSIAVDILNLVKDRLRPADQYLNEFRELVVVSNRGDAILVAATTQNPQLSADIANLWAIEAAATINLAYSGEQPLPVMQNLLASAEQDYKSAQTALEGFVENNQISLLTNRIREANSLLTRLADYRTWQINFYDQRSRDMEQLIVQTTALKNQLETGGSSGAGTFGDGLAVLNARTSALGIGSNFNLDLQLTDLSSLADEKSRYAADLEAIIQEATAEKVTAEALLESLSQEVTSEGSETRLREIAALIQDLEAQLERQEATQLELRTDRDLAWEAFQALAQKEVEIKNASQTENLVTVANQAIPPSKAVSRQVVRNTLLAALFGFTVGVIWLFGRQWLETTNASEIEPESGA